jgi:hypothetical protein
MTQTITRLYDSYDTALQVALALKEAGFTDRDVSIVASRANTPYAEPETSAAADDAGTGATFGGAIGAAAGLMAGMGVLAIPGIGPVVAAGWLASTLAVGAAGAVAGGVTGGIVGALANTGTDDEIQVYAESIRRGDTLVTVRAPDDRVLEATRILSSYRHVDAAAREAEYRGAGWERFDEAGRPYVETRDENGRPYVSNRQDPVLPAGLPRTPPV